MAFVDEVTVHVKAGSGGNGASSLHSEPFKPRGGPDGGNGGAGGSVIFEVSREVHDLSWLADHPHQSAGAGAHGRSANREGASGKDLVVALPDGTVVFDERGLLADLVGDGARAVVARGGRGGRGNAAFAGPRNRVPRTAEPGEAGEERRLRLELRTVADVALVGMPNAGKSTLLSRLTAATPKIADYPFTTLTPNLGVADVDDERIVVADVPGLLEGAHRGKGLGHRFLRHVERCAALVFVIDLSSEDPASDLEVVRRELAEYDAELMARPRLIVGTKADLIADAPGLARDLAPEAVAVSAVSGEGIEELRARVGRVAQDGTSVRGSGRPYVVLRPGRPRFTVEREGSRWRVRGQGVERWILETDMEDDRQVARLQKKLVREGVERHLAELGARRGDEVVILDRVFEFLPDETARDKENDGQQVSDGR